MDKAELLREIADVMASDPCRGYTDFEWNIAPGGCWIVCTDGWSALLYRADNTHTYGIRRRPSTIRVSGSVSEEAIQAAHWLAQEGRPGKWKYSDVEMVSRALLDLVEKGGE